MTGVTGNSVGEFKLNDPPADGVTRVRFSSGDPTHLITSSWDKTIRFYDVNSNTMKRKTELQDPLLDTTFLDAGHVYSGGLSCVLILHDLSTGTDKFLGRHNDAIRNIELAPRHGVVCSGSWDSTVKLWDCKTDSLVGTHHQGDKVYSLSVSEEKLVVATADRKVLIWDFRNMATPLQRRESSLKYQTRSVCCFPNQQGFVLSSIEGRVAVEFFDLNPEIQKKKYAFKCHRLKGEDNIEQIYPVNAIAFHNRYNTFATGGSDGYVNLWDGFNKKRLCQFHRYLLPISSLSFSDDGSMLAIASSFTHVDQNEAPSADIVSIRHISDTEAKPK